MTTRSDYSQDEWDILKRSVVLPGLLISKASPSDFIGQAIETEVMLDTLKKMAKDETATQLLIALTGEMAVQPDPTLDGENEDEAILEEEAETDGQPQEASNLPPPGQTGDQLQAQEWLENLRQAASIVEQKAVPGEATQYKQWLMQSAIKVAEAAKEGSFLGFGGQKVSAAEAKLLEEIAAALGLSA